MSLVNDMLRDLDQRRKESDGPAARIKLTPAGDYPRQERRNWVPAIALGLAVIASGLGYTWMQMNQSSTPQQIATTVAPVTINDAINEEGTPVAEVAVPDAVPEPQSVAPAAPAANAAVNETSLLEVVSDVPPIPEQLQELAALPSTDELVAAAGPTASVASVVTPSVPAASVSNPGAPAASVRNPDRSAFATEPVKDTNEPSPEQRDTLVVQEALRLLANNQPTAAYTRLEQHLLDNPYAHQSRETYAKFLMNSGDVHSALALVDSGLGLAPNHSGFKKVKARLLITAGEIQTAVELLQSRAPAVARDLEYHEILASAQLASRDFEGAALSYTSLVQQDQTQGKWWYGFAASQDALGNNTAARQAYTRAVEKPNLSTNLRRRSQDRLTALGQ